LTFCPNYKEKVLYKWLIYSMVTNRLKKQYRAFLPAYFRLPLLLLLLLVSMAVGIQSCLVQRVDRTPYAQMDYYQETKDAMAHTSLTYSDKDTVRVGWAKVNLTPASRIGIAGYGKRKGKDFESVHDSAWVRAFVFSNGITKAALVTMDLLIVPMTVTEQLEQQLPALGFDLSNTYLTATHSHSSLGGWGKRIAGRMIAGKYDEQVVARLTAAILEAIEEAEAKATVAQIGFAELNAAPFVYNRLVGSAGTLDTLLRVLQFTKPTGERAVLSSFSAHATCLGAENLALSCDYPGELVQELEQDDRISFAAFAAGAVGSHGPAAEGAGWEKVRNQGRGLSRLLQAHLDSIPQQHLFRLSHTSVPLGLRSPHLRIAEDWRLRPWLFNALFGEYPSRLSMLGLGNYLLVGTPCDFSGELLPDLQSHAAGLGKNLILTSFNGGYVGYITPDKYYDLKKYETRDMNFFGPGNGAYFSELIRDLLDKASD
jgi:neutral ceramidase